MALYKDINGVQIELTTDEENAVRAEWQSWNDKSAERKIAKIRQIRNEKLNETDWQVTMAKEKGTNLTTSFKNWRQGLRDIPTTYTTESEYDELLATDENGNLTHSVWSE